MTKKQVKILICLVQAALLALLFLPAASTVGAGAVQLSTVDIVHRYADMGHPVGAGIYSFFAVCCPTVSLFSLFLFHERKNLAFGACFSAFNLLLQGCFYTAMSTEMAATVTLAGLGWFIVFLTFVAMSLEIYGYLISAPAC